MPKSTALLVWKPNSANLTEKALFSCIIAQHKQKAMVFLLNDLNSEQEFTQNTSRPTSVHFKNFQDLYFLLKKVIEIVL